MKSLLFVPHRQVTLFTWLLMLALLLQQLPALPRGVEQAVNNAAPVVTPQAKLQENYGKLPLNFEANRGQAPAPVEFLARGQGYNFMLTPDEAVMQLHKDDAPQQFVTLRMRLAKAKRQPRLSGAAPLPGKSNYFLGNDPQQWQTDVPTFGKVKYESVYPGIDLVYYGNQQQLEYDFIVAPGSAPSQIKMQFAGAERVRIAESGELVLETAAGEVRQHKPFTYQAVNGVKQPVASRYVLHDQNEVGFEVAAYDASQPLVIDPILSYSTFLGGKYAETANGIAVDAAGNAYVTGRVTILGTETTDFPTTAGSFQATRTPGYDTGQYCFVTKFNPTGTAIIYSAIFGGTKKLVWEGGSRPYNNLEQRSLDIAVDAAGNAYVTGWARCLDFPATPGALQTQVATNTPTTPLDTFVIKLNATGSALAYATLLGQGNSSGASIAVDSQGRAWVTGNTGNPNFPTTTNAYQRVMKNLGVSAFVAQLNTTGTQLLYATYLTSGSGEQSAGIAVDAADNAYVTGTTSSSCDGVRPPVAPFPTTEGAYRRDLGEGCAGLGGSSLAYVTKFTSTGAVAYSTLIGVGRATAIAVDAAGNAYLTGEAATNFPVTPGAFQTQVVGTRPGSGDLIRPGFVTKLNPTGSALVYSTFINGGAGDRDAGLAIAVDGAGNAYVVGNTSGPNFPLKDTTFEVTEGTYLAKFNPTGSALDYSIVLGGGYGEDVAVDRVGNAYLTGFLFIEENFPTTPNAFQTQRFREWQFTTDAFVAKISVGAPARPVLNVSAASYTGTRLASESIVTAFGSGLATTTQAASVHPLPTTLAGTTVKVRDSAGVERVAQLFFVSPSQINYLLPMGTANGAATITVTSSDGTVSSATAQIESVAPGLFTADASGRGLASAVVLRVKNDGTQSYEPIARYDTVQNKLVAVPIDLGAATDQVFLVLYGTGMRYRSGMSTVTAQLGGMEAQPLFTGAQGALAGLDQANLRIPRALAGRGETDVALNVDGKAANVVKIQIK